MTWRICSIGSLPRWGTGDRGPGTGGVRHERVAFQGVGGLAVGDGSGQGRVCVDRRVSARRALRVVSSAAAGRCLGAVEHRRRQRTCIDGGLRTVRIACLWFDCGTADAIAPVHRSGPGRCRPSPGCARGRGTREQDAPRLAPLVVRPGRCPVPGPRSPVPDFRTLRGLCLMPKRTDIQTVLIIGAGPIVIGQACEFDYSGAQACKALRDEGYRVVLVNSNPATIMTDPGMADAVYIEPINWQSVEKIIAKEKPDALLPTMGGQTALNCALDLADHGVLEEHGLELIGASRDAIRMAEDRELFKQAMAEIGLECQIAEVARTFEEAVAAQAKVGYPTIIRPSFTLGGSGGGIAYNKEEFEEIAKRGLELSPVHEIVVEESVLGWKEFEMEVVRDKADNCIIVCSIENLDPMGVHTGDSITVAPAQTLTDKEY